MISKIEIPDSVAAEADRARVENLVVELAEPYGEWSALDPEKVVALVLNERQAAREPLEARIRELEAEVARLRAAAQVVVDAFEKYGDVPGAIEALEDALEWT